MITGIINRFWFIQLFKVISDVIFQHPPALTCRDHRITRMGHDINVIIDNLACSQYRYRDVTNVVCKQSSLSRHPRL